MITNIKNLEKYCTDYKNIENYKDAVSSPLRYDLHHRREISEKKSKKQLIDENLYYGRPPEELVFLEHGEHMRLHKANMSEETRQKISDARKGKHLSTETRQKMSDAMKGKNVGKHLSAAARKKMSNAKKGKHFSEEHKQKLSIARKGKHWHIENGKHVYTD